MCACVCVCLFVIWCVNEKKNVNMIRQPSLGSSTGGGEREREREQTSPEHNTPLYFRECFNFGLCFKSLNTLTTTNQIYACT